MINSVSNLMSPCLQENTVTVHPDVDHNNLIERAWEMIVLRLEQTTNKRQKQKYFSLLKMVAVDPRLVSRAIFGKKN